MNPDIINTVDQLTAEFEKLDITASCYTLHIFQILGRVSSLSVIDEFTDRHREGWKNAIGQQAAMVRRMMCAV